MRCCGHATAIEQRALGAMAVCDNVDAPQVCVCVKCFRLLDHHRTAHVTGGVAKVGCGDKCKALASLVRSKMAAVGRCFATSMYQ